MLHKSRVVQRYVVIIQQIGLLTKIIKKNTGPNVKNVQRSSKYLPIFTVVTNSTL